MRLGLISLHFAEYAARLALALAEQHDIQLHLCAANARKELEAGLLERLRGEVELLVHQPSTRKRAIPQGAAIAGALRRFRVEVIHAQEAGQWSLYVARLFGPRVPLVYTVHDPVPHVGDDEDTYRRNAWPSRCLRRRASAAIVHGRRLVGLLERTEPVLVGKVYAVPHGQLGEPPARGVVRDRRRLLFFGRFKAYKGLGVLVKAARLLEQRGIDHELVIAGRGSDLDRHRPALAALPRVVIRDYHIPPEEVGPLLASAGLVLAPYLEATQSGVVAHALTAGTPVIASQAGALPDVISHGVNGLLVPAGDAAALADAIARVLDDTDLAEALIQGAEAVARELLSWPAIARATTDIYLAALRSV